MNLQEWDSKKSDQIHPSSVDCCLMEQSQDLFPEKKQPFSDQSTLSESIEKSSPLKDPESPLSPMQAIRMLLREKQKTQSEIK